jgi:hypothetical protein
MNSMLTMPKSTIVRKNMANLEIMTTNMDRRMSRPNRDISMTDRRKMRTKESIGSTILVFRTIDF